MNRQEGGTSSTQGAETPPGTVRRPTLDSADRLLIVTPDFPPHLLGGGGVVCEHLAREYRRTGRQVDVISMDTSRAGLWASPKVSAGDDGTVTFLPMATRMDYRQGSLLLKLPPSLTSLAWLLREYRRDRWTAVHLHGTPSTLVDLAAALCRLRGRRFVVTFHGIPQDIEELGGLGSRIYRLLRAIERRIFAAAIAMTAVSTSTLNEVEAAGFRCARMLMVPNAAPDSETDAFVPEDGARADLSDSDLRPGDFALCLGAYTPRKGQAVALEAFHLLTERRRLPGSFRLVFAGYERDLGFVESLHRRAGELGLLEHLRFLGPLPEERKRTWLRSARWVLMPSTYEASPILAFEALRAVCVLIASDLAAFREVVGSEDHAVLFRPGDAENLGQAIEGLLDHPERERALRVAACERAKSLASWDEVALRYLSLLGIPIAPDRSLVKVSA